MVTNCIECVHRNVCLRGKVARHIFCKNYVFGRSDVNNCERCSNRYDCLDDGIKLFDCSHFWDIKTIECKKEN